MTEREEAIMNEAFIIGRIYNRMGEKESPAEIQEKLKAKCKIKADSKQRLETRQHEPIVMSPISIKAKQTMPVELVAREEYEQIKTFYKDVYHLLGSMRYDPDAQNVNELLNRAKAFVDRHEY